MADDQQSTEQPNPQGSGNEGGEKLFFGKYKSLEEAEKGYRELEQGFHAKAQEASQWREIADRPINVEYGRQGRGDYNIPYQPQPSQDQAAQELTQLYQDPVGWKARVKQEAAQEAAQAAINLVSKQEALKARVEDWRSRNKDLDSYQDLLESHVRRTDGRLAPETRLDIAAGEVRKRLVELRGSGQRVVDQRPEDYIDGPSGQRDGGEYQPTQSRQPDSAEAELAKFVNQRNSTKIKRLGTHH